MGEVAEKDRRKAMTPEKRIAELERALRVIHTWASYDKEQYEKHGHNPGLLNLDYVIDLCEKALKGYYPTKKG